MDGNEPTPVLCEEQRYVRNRVGDPRPVQLERVRAMNRFSHTDLLLVCVVVVMMGVVASTDRVFSHTLDEPAHVASGYDWLKRVPYTLDVTHPPLARALFALPALIEGITRSDAPHFVDRGNAIFYANGRYQHNVASARLPNLLFLAIGMLASGAWTAVVCGPRYSWLGALLFASPPVLGHAGVATTDLAVAAMIPAALIVARWWMCRPTVTRAAVSGSVIGCGLLTKFSFLPFFCIGLGVLLLLNIKAMQSRWKRLAGTMAVVVIVSAVAVFAGYRFEVATVTHACSGCEVLVIDAAPPPLRATVERFTREQPIPAPLFFVGLAAVRDHAIHGHESFFLGEYRDRGWWYYFPVLIAVKSPISLLLATGVGTALLLVEARRQRRAQVLLPLAIALGILMVGISSPINIGIRHLLPIYAFLSATAAAGIAMSWNRASVVWKGIAVLLCVGFLFEETRAYPDHIAWFNAVAGSHPEEIAVDSNLDWGQDILRLARVLDERHIRTYGALIVTSTYLEYHAPGSHEIPKSPQPGWYVVSETALKLDPTARSGGLQWLVAERSFERIGHTLRLYRVRPI